MIESQAKEEARRRWGTASFASYKRLGGPGKDLYAVGENDKVYGIGINWEYAFVDADSCRQTQAAQTPKHMAANGLR